MKRAKRIPAWLERRGFTTRTKALIAAALEQAASRDRDGADAGTSPSSGNTVSFAELQRLRATRHALGRASPEFSDNQDRGAADPGQPLRLIG
ncbi:hypothetical protein U8607_09740 [Methylobacterium durans]|uniref:hypothetical protein n=1 Tax=Methylobacterium durans TaxID=2202825 RepID=UPI002B0013E9|nr:hypothetical protein [Methylobacterium durans]MEA1832366.1 hypothetical protein [Methylobacterium durans]